MRDDLRCDCHICELERHIFDFLAESPDSIEFLRFASTSPQLEKFTNVSELLAYLHSPRSGDYACSDVGQILMALVAALATVSLSGNSRGHEAEDARYLVRVQVLTDYAQLNCVSVHCSLQASGSFPLAMLFGIDGWHGEGVSLGYYLDCPSTYLRIVTCPFGLLRFSIDFYPLEGRAGKGSDITHIDSCSRLTSSGLTSAVRRGCAITPIPALASVGQCDPGAGAFRPHVNLDYARKRPHI